MLNEKKFPDLQNGLPRLLLKKQWAAVSMCRGDICTPLQKGPELGRSRSILLPRSGSRVDETVLNSFIKRCLTERCFIMKSS